MQICPKCKKELDDMVSLCPSCGELLFNEPIKVNEVSEEYLQETLEDMIEDESIVTRIVVKGWLGFIALINIIKDKILLGLGFLRKNAGKYTKRFFTVDILKFLKWLGIKLKLDKLKPYITYVNMLGTAIVIASVCLVALGIRQFVYFDKTSEVARVDNKSTFADINKMYDKEANQQLDLETGTIVYSYENEEIAGVKCNVFYCVNPDNNLVSDIYIQYPKNVFNTRKIRNYILVNYGIPKSTKLKVAWEYECEDYRYEFSNDAYKTANEQFHVIYEKNAPTEEDLAAYTKGLSEGNITKNFEKDFSDDMKSGEKDSQEKETDEESGKKDLEQKVEDKSNDKDE